MPNKPKKNLQGAGRIWNAMNSFLVSILKLWRRILYKNNVSFNSTDEIPTYFLRSNYSIVSGFVLVDV